VSGETVQFIEDSEKLRLKDVKTVEGLSRTERLQYRNEKILQDLAVGISRKTICEEYRLSNSRLSEIIIEAEEEASSWYRELTKTHAIALHNINQKKYLQCIVDLELLRKSIDKEENLREYIQITKDIAELRKGYDSLIADGSLFRRVKELEEMLENDRG
jgi:uncharacterized protein (DUF433 family)